MHLELLWELSRQFQERTEQANHFEGGKCDGDAGFNVCMQSMGTTERERV